MVVFPENMNHIPEDDEKQAISMLDDYIRYMRERIEHSFGSLTKSLSGEMSVEQMRLAIQELQQDIATLNTRVSLLSGRVTNVELAVLALQPLIRDMAPDTDTAGRPGQLCIVEATEVYICLSANEGSYVWAQIL